MGWCVRAEKDESRLLPKGSPKINNGDSVLRDPQIKLRFGEGEMAVEGTAGHEADILA